MALGHRRRKPKESKKHKKARLRAEVQASVAAEKQAGSPKVITEKKEIELPAVITVRDFANVLGLSVGQILSALLKNGVSATINESIDFETAAIVADELEFTAKKIEEGTEGIKEEVKGPKSKTELRPPVVTVMGHVDHGKTALLDAIRSTNVVAQESGGITQHIGAYQVEIEDKEKKKRKITFLDTPGHEAFSAMRAQGANITDIVVLVVAANEGVKPQTIEALSHAKAANVPVVVAINKIDLPDANPDKPKRELSDQGLVPEEWGGKTPMVPVSAKTGEGVPELLELILLVADLNKISARKEGPAEGVVIESQVVKGLGPVATVLIQGGLLKVGDTVAVGNAWGRLRTIEDDRGRKLKEAGPGTPVRVSGLSDIPSVGNRLKVVEDEKQAREMARNVKTIIKPTLRLSDLSSEVAASEIKELNLVIKADVAGSLTAIRNILSDLATPEVSVKVIHEGLGAVTETDVTTAEAGKAMVVGFKVTLPPAVSRLAEERGVKVAVYDVIYELADDVRKLLEAILPPEIIETEAGKMTVTHLFKQTRKLQILGGKVTKGAVEKGPAEIRRGDQKLGVSEIQTVQIEKQQVASAPEGREAGIMLLPNPIYVKVKAGDVLVVKKIEKRPRTLPPAKSAYPHSRA
jgi:translation initiation factor IF-2